MTTEDKRNAPTVPAPSSERDRELTAKCIADREKRRESNLEAAVLQGLLDSLDVHTLSAAIASGDERRARFAMALFAFVEEAS